MTRSEFFNNGYDKQLLKDYMWFQDNYPALQMKYGNSYLGIKDGHVVAAYNNYDIGIKEMLKQFDLGTFIVQECRKSGDIPVAYIASMNFSSID